MRLAPTLLLIATCTCGLAVPAWAADAALPGALSELDRLLKAGDAAGAQALLPVADSAWKPQVTAYLANLAADGKAGRLDLKLVEAKDDGDTGALLVDLTAAGTRSTVAFFAQRTGGTWTFLPTPTVAYRGWYGLDDDRRVRLDRLAVWAKARIAELARARSGGVATWAFGEGTAAGAALKPGAAIALGQRIETGPKRPARLSLATLHDSSLVLAAGTAVTLVDEPQADGSTHLVIDLHQGTVQADINDLGQYAKVRLRGATSDVVVTGTLFMVQRVQPKAGEAADVGEKDYIVQVRGNVKVRRRGAVGDDWVNLYARQGLEIGSAGLGSVESLINRPDLSSGVYASMDLRAQALAAPQALLASGATAAGGASWTAPVPAELAAPAAGAGGVAPGDRAGAGGAPAAGGGATGGGATGGTGGGTTGGGGTGGGTSGGGSGSGSSGSSAGTTTLTTLSGSGAAGVAIDANGQVSGGLSGVVVPVSVTAVPTAQVDTAGVNQVVSNVVTTLVQPPPQTPVVTPPVTPPAQVLGGAPGFPQ